MQKVKQHGLIINKWYKYQFSNTLLMIVTCQRLFSAGLLWPKQITISCKITRILVGLSYAEKTILPCELGPVSIWRPSFPGMGIPMLKVRRSQDHLIFKMGIPILVRWHLYIEMAPWVSCHRNGLGPFSACMSACCLTNIRIPIIKMRWSHDNLISIMEIPMPKMTVFKLKRAPDFCCQPISHVWKTTPHDTLRLFRLIGQLMQ